MPVRLANGGYVTFGFIRDEEFTPIYCIETLKQIWCENENEGKYPIQFPDDRSFTCSLRMSGRDYRKFRKVINHMINTQSRAIRRMKRKREQARRARLKDGRP